MTTWTDRLYDGFEKTILESLGKNMPRIRAVAEGCDESEHFVNVPFFVEAAGLRSARYERATKSVVSVGHRYKMNRHEWETWYDVSTWKPDTKALRRLDESEMPPDW